MPIEVIVEVPVPPNIYAAQVTGIEEKTSRVGDHPFRMATFVIEYGAYTGQILYMVLPYQVEFLWENWCRSLDDVVIGDRAILEVGHDEFNGVLRCRVKRVYAPPKGLYKGDADQSA